jgi:hypothetical protein
MHSRVPIWRVEAADKTPFYKSGKEKKLSKDIFDKQEKL